jgi:hypothetical protein
MLTGMLLSTEALDRVVNGAFDNKHKDCHVVNSSYPVDDVNMGENRELYDYNLIGGDYMQASVFTQWGCILTIRAISRAALGCTALMLSRTSIQT